MILTPPAAQTFYSLSLHSRQLESFFTYKHALLHESRCPCSRGIHRLPCSVCSNSVQKSTFFHRPGLPDKWNSSRVTRSDSEISSNSHTPPTGYPGSTLRMREPSFSHSGHNVPEGRAELMERAPSHLDLDK